jgi:hypothetical protein
MIQCEARFGRTAEEAGTKLSFYKTLRVTVKYIETLDHLIKDYDRPEQLLNVDKVESSHHYLMQATRYTRFAIHAFFSIMRNINILSAATAEAAAQAH